MVTFTLGVAAGRRWPSGLPLPGLRGATAATAATPGASGAPAAPVAETGRRAEGRGLDKGKATTEGAPVLTFYRELTAPLTPPPPPTRGVAKRDARPAEMPKPAETTKPAQRPAEAMKPVTSDVSAAVEAPPREPVAAAVAAGAAVAAAGAAASPTSLGVAGPRFTVQVGAFKARAQAEALRARLAESGQEADVSEVEAGGVTQYRVRVGTFATRAAARDAAARLGAERQLATYVTTR